MKRIVGVIVFLLFLGTFSVKDAVHSSTFTDHQVVTGLETSQIFEFEPAGQSPDAARVRGSNSSFHRLKNERNLELSPSKSWFFYTCRIAKSYSEIHLHRYFKLFIQFAIQVNAP